ncbi:hypothetical protein pipiens_007211 [Culex pipiens pipiens]|uniref:Uncharacterized protein n=1 Tax=Culex pipiens pipiens TaxID=38569 RepID=A0ABD1DLW4_CULPP
MQSEQKVEIIVDDLLADPDLLEEDEHDPELRELLLTTWQLNPEVYVILRSHGYSYDYLKQIDDRALNDVFSVAKWTGHKYALRNKLVQWPESKMVEEPCTSSAAGQNPEFKPKQHNLLASSVTRNLLDDILSRNEKGKLVCQFYDSHQKLSTTYQKWLGHTIVDYYLANKTYFTLADMARFSELIADKFKSEICATYYNPRSARDKKKHPSGLLYDRFHNPLDLPETEIQRLVEIRQWLRNNVAPQETLTTNWHDSILLRLRSLQENSATHGNLFDEWPRYLDDGGYLLIDDDFHQLFGSSGKLLTSWGNFCEKFKRYITDIKIGDQHSQSLQSGLLSGVYNEDYRDYAVAVLFHAVIKPSRTSSHNLPSILTAQLATCTICATEAEFRTECEKLRDPSGPNKGQLSPRIFAIGGSSVLSTFYVLGDKYIYKLPTFLRCLDVLVKATHVLNYPFLESCETLFCFLSRHFYGIDYKRKSKIGQLLKLLAFLESE